MVLGQTVLWSACERPGRRTTTHRKSVIGRKPAHDETINAVHNSDWIRIWFIAKKVVKNRFEKVTQDARPRGIEPPPSHQRPALYNELREAFEITSTHHSQLHASKKKDNG